MLSAATLVFRFMSFDERHFSPVYTLSRFDADTP